jgi:hypothetical protein
MDTHVISICTGVLLASIALIANVLAWVLTELHGPVLDFKPFNCWGCLSFWLTLIFGFTVALEMPGNYQCPETQTVETYGIAGATILLGFVNYLWVKSKYQVYE